MDYEGSLHFVRTENGEYSVTFTPYQEGSDLAGARTFAREADFAQFLLHAGFDAQHADGIQGAVDSVGHHTVDDFRISDKEWRRLFTRSAAHATGF